MSTLNDALNSAMSSLTEQITAGAVKELKESSEALVFRIRAQYDDFFQTLHEKVLNDSGASGEEDFTPAIFRNSGVEAKPWRQLSEGWLNRKSKADTALEFYHGLTMAMSQNKKRKRKSKKPRTNMSFDMFIQSMALGGATYVDAFFGPLKVTYEMTRPDGGKVNIKTLDQAVDVVRQFRGKGTRGGGAKPIDGTILSVKITAFEKLGEVIDERSLIGYMISENGNKNQWLKISNGVHQVRAILLPLINWYLKVQFQKDLELFAYDIS